MQPNPCVSVILPFYNRINLTCQAVESVFAQTHKNFEIILIDDGSTEPVERLTRIKDPRLKVVSQHNLGPAAARNHGIRVSSGDYIAFLDSDDLFLPEKLEYQLENHMRHPDIVFSHTNYLLVEENGAVVKEMDTSQYTGLLFSSLYYDCMICMSTVIIHKSFLTPQNLFIEKYRVSEDIIFYANAARKAGVLGLNRALTKVRNIEKNNNRQPQAQISGSRNILDFLNNASAIPGSEKRFIYSRLYTNIALNYLILKKYAPFVQNGMRSLIYAPVRSNVIARAISMLQPLTYIKKKLKR